MLNSDTLMTDAQLASVGAIIIGWGTAERMIGSAIGHSKPLGSTILKKVLSLGLDQKIEVLVGVAQEINHPRLLETARAIRTWKKMRGDERNIIAHGISSYSPGGLLITSHSKHIHVYDLPLAVASAKYVAALGSIAYHLTVQPLLANYPDAPPAPRPPTRLAEIRVGFDGNALARPLQGPYQEGDGAHHLI